MQQEEHKPTFVPYREWMEEAEKVTQEDMVLFGFAPSPNGVMLRANNYVMKLVENDRGGIDGVLVWAGWQQAMRKNRQQ